jgi:hypothetical protein
MRGFETNLDFLIFYLFFGQARVFTKASNEKNNSE